MILRATAVALIALGAVWVVYLYHVRPRRFDTSGRSQHYNWPLYDVFDWVLRLTTVGVSALAILFDHWLLLEVHRSNVLLIVGMVVSGISLGLFTGAILTLGAEYSPAHHSLLPNHVVTSGPYRYVRHPIYTANVLLIVGLFLAGGSLWLVPNLVLLVGHYTPTILREEEAIRQRFPEYADYMQRTGRFLPRFTRLVRRHRDAANR